MFNNFDWWKRERCWCGPSTEHVWECNKREECAADGHWVNIAKEMVKDFAKSTGNRSFIKRRDEASRSTSNNAFLTEQRVAVECWWELHCHLASGVCFGQFGLV